MKIKTSLFITTIIVLCSFQNFSQDIKVVDSILSILPKIDDKAKTPYYTELTWQYIHSDLNKAFEYSETALAYAEKFKDTNQLSDAYNTIAATYTRIGDYSNAILYNNKALEIRKAINDIRGMGSSHSKLGIIYTDQGWFEKALHHQLLALNFFIESEDIAGEAQTYNNICQIYNYLENLEMAILYANKCIEIYKKVDYPYGEAGALGNLALFYEKKEMYDSCIYFLEISRDLFLSINDMVDVAISENAIGLYFRKLGNHEKGLEHYQKAFDIAKELNDFASISQFGANLAAVQLDLGKSELAFKNYHQALEFAKQESIQRVERQCYDGLANYNERKGNYKEALKYRKLYEEIDNVINSEETQKAMIEADAKFQNTLKNQQIAEQKVQILKEASEKSIIAKQKAEKDLELKQKQTWWAISLGIMILLIFIVLWFNKKKQLTQQKEHATKLAEEKEKAMQMTLNAQEEERQRIAKDLHDGIVQEIVATKMELDKIDTKLTPELSNKINHVSVHLNNTANEVRNLSHQMMPLALKELGLIPALKDLLEKVLSLHNIEYEFNIVGNLDARLPEKIEISLYRITQELINNTIKHSKADFASLTLSRRPKHLFLIFEDNGKGFESNSTKKGLGMSSLDSRVKMLNGKIEFESQETSGTTAIINIPL